MRSLIRLIVCIVLLFVVTGTTNGQSVFDKKMKTEKAGFLSLDGQVLPKGNPVEADGTILQFNSPALRLVRTKSKFPKGAVLLLPGGGYELLKVKNEGENVSL